jgi:hypothetical protein
MKHIDNTDLLTLIAAFDRFDGTCDPAFDNEYDELERQFAELRRTQPCELN